MRGRTPDLPSLLGSRICHDLISPLSAISNGVELLEMSGDMSSEEFKLVAESIAAANARIRFFRVAFGSVPRGGRISNQEITSIITDLNRGSRQKIEWLDEGDPLRGEVKLAFLLILCLETTLPFGGTIRARQDGRNWDLVGQADRTRIDLALWNLFSDRPGPDEVDPASIQFALVPDTARRLDRAVVTDLREGCVKVSF